MATYLELRDLFAHDDLRAKTESAVCIASNTIRKELVTVPNHVERLVWARAALLSPRDKAEVILKMLLADNAGTTKATILAATDVTIQTLVNDSVNFFAVG